MASLVGTTSHELSIFHFNEPAEQVGSEMPPDDVVVISDDDDDEHEHDIPPARNVRPRSDLASSPFMRRNSKRQKMEYGPPGVEDEDDIEVVAQASGTKRPQFPRVELNFDQDEDGFVQAFPTFLNQIAERPPVYCERAASPINLIPSGDVEPVGPHNPRPVREETPCPYVDDPKLNLRMFCGPGYQHFPIPVDADEKFQDKCDAYDEKMARRKHRREEKQTRYNAFGPYVDNTIEVEDDENSESDDNIDRPPTYAQRECLAKVVEILPDIDQDFVLDKIRYSHESYNFGDEEIEIVPDAAAIVSDILEMEDYPRGKRHTEEVKIPFEEETGKTIKWDKEHCGNRDYQKDSVILLATHFNYVPTRYIDKTMAEKKSLWDTYIHLEDLDTNWFQRTERPYKRLRHPRTQLERKYQRMQPYPTPQYYVKLVTEFQAVKQHVARVFLQRNQDQEKANAEAENKERHKTEGLIVECQVCFDDEVPLNRTVSCVGEPTRHSFCFECVEQLANTQIGLTKYEMMCMDGSGCKEKLDMDGVGRALPIKTFDRLQLNQQQAELAEAFPEGLEQCPFCDFKALCGPTDEEPIFSCQHPDCYKVTCRKCHEVSHPPKSCEEAKKDRGLSARHTVEEARSEAMMRTCPQCKKKIVKEVGCNKMRCTCGAILCYVCQLDLSKLRDGYDHFNKGPNRCPLYDKGASAIHDRDADEAEMKAIQAAKAADQDLDETELQIETGKRKPLVARTGRFGIIRPNPVPDIRRRLDGLERRHAPRIGRNPAARGALPVNMAPLFPGGIQDLVWDDMINNPPQRHDGVQNPDNPLAGRPDAAAPRRLDRQMADLYAGPGDAFDDDLRNALNDNANQRDMLMTGNRVHEFRTDLARRRRSVAERRDNHNLNAGGPAQYPNAAFFNLRQTQAPQPGGLPNNPYQNYNQAQPQAVIQNVNQIQNQAQLPTVAQLQAQIQPNAMGTPYDPFSDTQTYQYRIGYQVGQRSVEPRLFDHVTEMTIPVDPADGPEPPNPVADNFAQQWRNQFTAQMPLQQLQQQQQQYQQPYQQQYQQPYQRPYQQQCRQQYQQRYQQQYQQQMGQNQVAGGYTGYTGGQNLVQGQNLGLGERMDEPWQW